MNDSEAQLDFAWFYQAKQVEAVGDTVDERFASFHTLNPHVYRAIVTLAKEHKSRGHKRLSMRGLFEFLRIDYALRTVGDLEFKLNNSYSPRYSRLLCELDPDLGELFETRERCDVAA